MRPLETNSSGSGAGTVDPRAWSVIARGRRAGGKVFVKGDSVNGLPADFLVGPDGVQRAAKYGRHASDHWSVDELLALAG
ncbi:hypothetical protein [Actinophytocola sp.]|uniref:hypothetical protein n=1 Tax=Actinophytocola sp. TaxID=1872138 RepID=UPI0025BA0D14|nr:hypothetical protein [Actinophytocola sp.]